MNTTERMQVLLGRRREQNTRVDAARRAYEESAHKTELLRLDLVAEERQLKVIADELRAMHEPAFRGSVLPLYKPSHTWNKRLGSMIPDQEEQRIKTFVEVAWRSGARQILLESVGAEHILKYGAHVYSDCIIPSYGNMKLEQTEIFDIISSHLAWQTFLPTLYKEETRWVIVFEETDVRKFQFFVDRVIQYGGPITLTSSGGYHEARAPNNQVLRVAIKEDIVIENTRFAKAITDQLAFRNIVFEVKRMGDTYVFKW
jgi:hypothetical protein